MFDKDGSIVSEIHLIHGSEGKPLYGRIARLNRKGPITVFSVEPCLFSPFPFDRTAAVRHALSESDAVGEQDVGPEPGIEGHFQLTCHLSYYLAGQSEKYLVCLF